MCFLTASRSSLVASLLITISMGATLTRLALAAAVGGGDVALLGQLLVDDLLEDLVRVSPADLAAVDEGGGRAVHVHGRALLHVGGDLRLVLVAVQRRLELGHVEAQLLGVLLQAGAVELLLVGEQLVVHLPELALLAGGPGGAGGGLGVLVEGERVVLPGDADLARVLR